MAATSFVTAKRVAETILAALLDRDCKIDSLACAGEPIGVIGEHVGCTAEPSKGAGTITASVTSVRGLKVRFGYEVAP